MVRPGDWNPSIRNLCAGPLLNLERCTFAAVDQLAILSHRGWLDPAPSFCPPKVEGRPGRSLSELRLHKIVF